eukprot:1223996-Amphidinium_carterae.2
MSTAQSSYSAASCADQMWPGWEDLVLSCHAPCKLGRSRYVKLLGLGSSGIGHVTEMCQDCSYADGWEHYYAGALMQH